MDSVPRFTSGQVEGLLSGLRATEADIRASATLEEWERQLLLTSTAECMNEVRKHAMGLPPYDRPPFNIAPSHRPEPTVTARPPAADKKPSPPAKPVARQARAGAVYLLRSDMGHYKIGHTKNVRGRLAQFSVALPFGFEFIHTIACQDRMKAERQLHARFADRRNNGEWFDLTDEDVAYITSLTEL